MQTRLVFNNFDEVQRAKKLGITNLNKKYSIDDMIKNDVIFCATGVTDGDMLKGIKINDDTFEANSFILYKSQTYLKQFPT